MNGWPTGRPGPVGGGNQGERPNKVGAGPPSFMQSVPELGRWLPNVGEWFP
jgi:hypothetical protein